MNMNLFTEKVIAILIAITLVNSAFQYWYYNIDGIYVNKAITYEAGVDPGNLQLERSSYKLGDDVYFYNSFCKNRDSNAVIQWTLTDREAHFYMAKPAINIPVGCFPADAKEGGKTLIELEPLLTDVHAGCDYQFVGVIVRDIGNGRHITSTLKTQHFCITK